MKYKVGDRVKVYGHVIVYAETHSIRGVPFFLRGRHGKVVVVYKDTKGTEGIVEISKYKSPVSFSIAGSEVDVHFKQCRKIKRRKSK